MIASIIVFYPICKEKEFRRAGYRIKANNNYIYCKTQCKKCSASIQDCCHNILKKILILRGFGSPQNDVDITEMENTATNSQSRSSATLAVADVTNTVTTASLMNLRVHIDASRQEDSNLKSIRKRKYHQTWNKYLLENNHSIDRFNLFASYLARYVYCVVVLCVVLCVLYIIVRIAFFN